MDKIELLLEEKKLFHQEKLQLNKTIKQSIALLGSVITLLIAGTSQSKADAIYVLLPILINIFLYFLLTNINMFNIICEYLRRLDLQISEEYNDVLLFEGSVGSRIATLGFNMTKGKNYRIINPYYFYVFFAFILTALAYFYSVSKGCVFLKTNWGQFSSQIFLYLCICAFIVFVCIGFSFFKNYNRIRDDLFSL
jgi:hypothetical protein